MLPGPIREAVASLDPDVAVFRAQTLDDAIDAANSSSHWISLLFLVSGAVALFLATIGLYGVMAFWVIQRSREIGVRMALGGQRADVVRLVLGQGMRHAGIGLAVGALIALPVARLFASALFGVRPYDPVVFGTTMGVLGGVALLGCLLPARRATGLEPMDALASE